MRIKATVLGTVAALAVVETLFSLLTGREPASRSLALPPNQIVEYKTPDFQFQAATNRLGFRGPEFPVGKREGVYRIAVLGNSFAYGWGLEYEDTWPRQLERRLNEEGLKIEVANLATPGTSPRIISEIAGKSLPLLKPDMVLLAVLDGAAVVTYQPAARDERPPSWRQKLTNALAYALPGTVAGLQWVHDAVSGPEFIPASAASREWERQARSYLARAPDLERQRFAAIDPRTRSRFLSGNMNSPLVIQAIRKPDQFRDVVTSEALTEKAIEEMRGTFAEAKARSKNAIVVSMPYAAYLDEEAQRILRTVGFDVDFDLSVIDPVRAARTAAEEAGVSFVGVTDAFRANATAEMFIPFDGHYSPAGSRLFAELIAPRIAQAIRTGSK
ncbi:MAG: SGNH/GDSL hydrolase family protein [Bradyrhizobium sp.]|uniref:SGNH/GDSL hydrolase family protein n=1 Tax=Bradyrhizobium sp. TaxID=376 RepID=UPI0035439441